MNPQFTSSYEVCIKCMPKVVSPNIYPGLSELLVLRGDNCSSPSLSLAIMSCRNNAFRHSFY